MTDLELTVGIPVFNERFALVNAIASVVNQDWAGTFEILVVNDGSTDGTSKVLRRLSEQIPALRIVDHHRNLGRPAARSTLMSEARGRYFAMLDADDEWYPDKLSRQFAHLEARRKSRDVRNLMICGNIDHIDVDYDVKRTKNFAKGYGETGYSIQRVLKGDNTPISQLALLNTDFMRQIGPFDAELARAQDWDFLIRFFAAGGDVEFLGGAPLALFNFTKSGRSKHTIGRCMRRVIDKHQDLYRQHNVDPDAVRASIQKYVDSFE